MPGLVPQKADFVEDSVSSLPTMYTYILSTHIMLKVQSANPRPVICISNATSMKLVRGRHAAALPPPSHHLSRGCCHQYRPAKPEDIVDISPSLKWLPFSPAAIILVVFVTSVIWCWDVPLPVCQSAPGLSYLFVEGIPLNLHLPLVLGRGFASQHVALLARIL